MSNDPSNDEDEFVKRGVKLLIDQLRTEKVKVAPHLIDRLKQELKQVQFDSAGGPMIESIPRMVRSLAKATLYMESERSEAEELEREKQSPLHSMLQPAVEVSDEIMAQFTKDPQFAELAFELYKETLMVLFVILHVQVSHEKRDNFAFPRDQAICAALLCRITKFMRAVLAMLSHGDELGEVVLALSRCMAESVINLRYLIHRDDERLYNQFVKLSLSPERELYDVIHKNIEGREGEVLPIETRMLQSIDRLCKSAGVSISDVNLRYSDWDGGLRKRINALGLNDYYAGIQRVPSHAIHGTWVDLMLHHMDESPEGFVLKLDGTAVDPRLLGPLCILILTGATDYIDKYLSEGPEVRPIFFRANDLQQRLHKVEVAHEEWYQNTRRHSPAPD